MVCTIRNIDESSTGRQVMRDLMVPLLAITMMISPALSIARERPLALPPGAALNKAPAEAARYEHSHTEAAVTLIEGNYGIGISAYTMTAGPLPFGYRR